MTNLDHDYANHEVGTHHLPRQNPARRIDRRTLLKATAAFVAMATAAPNIVTRISQAEETATRAGEWNQPQNVGGATGGLTFEAEFPFNAVAPNWPGDTGFSGSVEIQLSQDGQAWSDPVVIGPSLTDAGPADRDGRIFGDLVLTEDASVVRYRALDANGNETAIAGLSFTYIDAKAGPSIDDVSAASPRPTLTRPPIISRDEWGASRAYGGADQGEVMWPPSYQTVKHVIIHHSETPRFRDPFVEIRSIHYYHSITRGWGDIGYNYLVDYMGNVYEGRVGGENAIGGHAFQYAQGSAGICTMGSFSLQHATPEAIAGLTWITSWAARKLDPLARRDFHETPNLPTVCGHRDVVNSSCPGDGLYADLPTIRSAVAEVIAGAQEVLQDPSYSPGQTIQTTTNDANLRALPGTGQSVVGTLPFGAVLHIVDGPTTTNGYTWYQVKGNRGTGWLASTLFKSSTAEPPTGQFAVGDSVEVDTDYLNIRSKASIRAQANATVPRGTKGKVLEGPAPAGGFRWYRLETSYGRGWAVEQYLIPPGTAKPNTRFLVGDSVQVDDRDGVRMRSTAGLGASVLRSLPFGTKGVVVGSARVVDAVTWLEVQTSLGTGWAAEPYFGPAPHGPYSDSKFSRGDVVRVDTDAVNLREAAGTKGAVIRSLGNGVVGTVIDPPSTASNMWWVRIDTDYGSGWVAEAFLASADGNASRDFSIGDSVYIDTDGINIRTSPSASAKVITILYQKETARVVDGPRSADGYVWYKLETKSNTGWGVSRYLGLGSADPGGTTGIALGDVVAVDTDGINLREAPGLSGKRVKVIYTNTKATVIAAPRKADGYTWVRLQAGSDRGWGVADYLKVIEDGGITTGQTARVFDGDLNLRSGAGSGNAVVAVLADGTWVDVVEGPVSAGGRNWVRVRSSRYGAGWCAAEFLART